MRPKRTIPQDLIDTDALVDRFWSKVAVGEPNDCWPFTRGRNRHGYGKFVVDERIHFAHRVAWALANGRDATTDFRVLHACDTPPCCNPAHLFLGTQNDNMQDMWDKGRHGARQARPGRVRGERCHDSKLTAADVLEIRRLASDGVRQDVLGARYGVTRQSIWAIVHRKKWKHV